MKLDKNTKVYIAGCGGMLGRAVYSYFAKRCIVKATDIDLNIDWLEYADVRDYKSMEESINDFQPELIINLAALTDLEFCENNAENSWLTNALGAENIALISKKLGVPMVYISTAGIVDGEQDVYNDFDAPNPLGTYAKSKYHGEVFVKNYLEKFFVFRAGWMMGGGPKKDKKFINKIYQQIKSGQKELFIVDDKLGTPTYTHSFARGIFKVVETDLYGVYNQVCEGDCSRYEVAVELVDLLGLSDDIKITKVSSDYFKEEYFAPRPASEKLINMKLNARGINFMPHWKEALRDYSKEFNTDLQSS
ncbi:SDR family oxidoreductase [uncultured Winogradskyella sp.]|uniref:SDR family oxidoreductase n=1 Tax=uncultured Winogradskyella sp. TaxID=395353 RepID=UPI0030D9AF2D|tara:strand:+ start:2315 stop:3232 length:918 start_codon:yes stop_codon:yes gene_type:complete